VSRVTRDRCFDLKKIFAEKIGGKIAVFDSNKAKLCMQKCDHNTGF
jgi:hypothetical protein